MEINGVDVNSGTIDNVVIGANDPCGPGTAWILEYLKMRYFCKYRTFSRSVWYNRRSEMIQEAPKKCKFLRGGDFFWGSMEHLDLTRRSQKKNAK